MDNKGAPLAYLMDTEPLPTLQFQCFFCKKMMIKGAISQRNKQLIMELKCPDHDLVRVVLA